MKRSWKSDLPMRRSAFGEAQRTCYGYIRDTEKILKRKYSVLVVDDHDGLHSMPFARSNNKVDCFEPEEMFYTGGNIDGFDFRGLKERLERENLTDYVTFANKNFYEERVETKYDFVYVYRSLHKDRNKNIPMDRKIRKLLSAVKENGYIYILYHLADKDWDYSNFGKEQYLRVGQLPPYLYDFDIISFKERPNKTIHNAHPYNNQDHKHRVGYVFARKKSKRIKHKFHYKINLL